VHTPEAAENLDLDWDLDPAGMLSKLFALYSVMWSLVTWSQRVEVEPLTEYWYAGLRLGAMYLGSSSLMLS
jgi:hypothetical protein